MCGHVVTACTWLEVRTLTTLTPPPPPLQTHRLLRGKALECVSLVGMAVGRDRFRADAARVLQWLQAAGTQEMDADDPTLGYMLQVCGCMCVGCRGGRGHALYGFVCPCWANAASVCVCVCVWGGG